MQVTPVHAAEFHKVSSLLKKIRKVAQEIIAEALPIMHILKFVSGSEDGNEIVDGVSERHPKVDPRDILFWAQDEMVQRVADAEKILEEYPKLMVKEGTSRYIVVPEGICPFFDEVWRGDVYDQEGPDALSALLKDLQEQKTKITVEDLVLTIADRISAGTLSVDFVSDTATETKTLETRDQSGDRSGDQSAEAMVSDE